MLRLAFVIKFLLRTKRNSWEREKGGFLLLLMTKGLILTVSFPGRQPAGQTEICYRENVIKNDNNRPFPSSPGPLYQNEVKCSAFDMEMIFHSHANKTHFHTKGSALGLFLKVRVYGTQKWPIMLDKVWKKKHKMILKTFYGYI